MSDEQTIPAPADYGVSNDAQSEQALFDAVLQNSAIAQELDLSEPLPYDEPLVPDTDDSYTQEDPQQYEESAYEEVEEVEEEAEVEDDVESTQDTEVYSLDDLDQDAMVRLKIDGEEVDVSFADLFKGYTTDASLSKKGRELGDARKALEEERATALAEVQDLAKASEAVLLSQEQQLAQEYHNVDAKLKAAQESGDTWELGDLRSEREAIQQKYWDARKQREGLQEQLKTQEEAERQQEYEVNMKYFEDNIQGMVPGFNSEVAGDIRQFAIDEGLPESMVDSVIQPEVVKFINDYRQLKLGVNRGAAKRKAAPGKVVPAKKGKTETQKADDKAKMVHARAMREDASKDDQMDFLKQYAAQSLGNLGK